MRRVASLAASLGAAAGRGARPSRARRADSREGRAHPLILTLREGVGCSHDRHDSSTSSIRARSQTHGWNIPAALTLPASADASELPSAILLVPGSLFSDVNGDYPSWNSFPHVYAHLARQLSARGHAVYRFAKLGPGTGSVATDADASARVRTWDGRLLIATAALDAMQRELAARGIRARRTIGAGHSEGSVVVSRLATSDRAA